MRRVLIFLFVFWMVVACAPAVPTRPPTRTPTPTVVRPDRPVAATEEIQPPSNPTGSDTPIKTLSPSVTPTTTPTPAVDLLACLPSDTGETGLVSWVIDGETFVVDQGGKLQTVRLLGVQALPFTKDVTRSLLDRQVVRMVPDGVDRDSHGRLLRYVLLLDGRFINDELLRNGAARLDTNVVKLSCMAQFSRAEDDAIQAGLGLWGMALAVLPTDFQQASPAGVGQTTELPVLTLTPGLTPATPVTDTPTIATPAIPLDNPGGSGGNPVQPGQTPGPVITPSPTGVQPSVTGTVVGTGVQIVYIFYHGLKSGGEPDEYIEIKNFETTPVDISYWLINAETNENWYIFPEFVIQPGQSCRVYTNEVHPDSCTQESFLSPQDDWEVWDNTADCGYLYNYLEAVPVSTKCYGQ